MVRGQETHTFQYIDILEAAKSSRHPGTTILFQKNGNGAKVGF